MASTRAPRVAGAHDPTRVAEEERLARRAAAGDGAAFATLYDRYERRIFTYCQRLLVSSEDAADATQDAFLKVLARLPKLDPGRELNVSAYLYTAARNACYDMIGRRRRAEPVEELPEPAALGPDGLQRAALDEDPERAALLESFQADVQEANARLPERQREVLVLRELEERSYDEIAELMDMNRNSVAQLISRARINLRDELRGTALASVAVSSADCERALPLISMRQDGQLRDGADRAWLEAHVAGCSTCRVSVDAVEEAGVSYRAWLPIVPLEWLREATIAEAGELVGSDWSEVARSPRDPGDDGGGSGHGEDGGGNGRGAHGHGGGTAAHRVGHGNGPATHEVGAVVTAAGALGAAGDAAGDSADASDARPVRRRRRLLLLAALGLLVLLAGTAAVVVGKDDAPGTDPAGPATPADDVIAPAGTGGGEVGDAAGVAGSGKTPGTAASGAPAGGASPGLGTPGATTVDAKTSKPGGSTRRGGAGGRRTTTPGARAPGDGGRAKPRKPGSKPDKPSGGGDGSRTPSRPPSTSNPTSDPPPSTPPPATPDPPPTSTPPTSTPPTSTPPTSTPPSTGTPGGGGRTPSGGGGGRTPSGGGGRTPSGGGGRTPGGGGSAPCPAGAVC